MTEIGAADVTLLVARIGLGAVFVAHGYNHIFGGGRIAGTGRWFDQLGMRPGIVHAWVASITELVVGILLILGIATPLACAGVVGTMVVALVTNHARNGFFIFRPGEGYEYVMTLIVMGFGFSGTGAGRISFDHQLGWWAPPGWIGLWICLLGGVGAVVLLATSWRPQRSNAVVP